MFDELSILAKPTEYEAKFIELYQAEKFIKRVNIDRYLVGKFRQSKIFKKVWAFDLPTSDKYELLFEVLNQLTLYGNKGETVKFLDFAIDAAQTKLKQKNDSVVE